MKKRMGMLSLSSLLFIFMFALLPNIKAEAASVTQTAATQNSVTISWQAPSFSTRVVQNYKIYMRTNYSAGYVLYATLNPNQTSIQIGNLPAGCSRHVKITYDYYYTSNPSSIYTSYYEYDVKTLPGKVTGLKQSRWWYFILEFDATWDKQDGVDGYEYIVKTNKNKVKASGSLSGYASSFSVRNISNNVVYSGQIRAYSTINGVKYYGAWSDTAYFFTQPRITKAKVSGNKLTVKWKKVGGATGYDVYVSTKKTKGYKKVKSVSSKTSSVTIKKLGKKKFSKKKTYYVYVVTKKKVNGRTSTSGRLYYWNTKNIRSTGYF